MRKWVLRACALAVSFVFLWPLVGSLIATHEEDRARRAWAETVLSMDEFEREHPKTPANAAALAVAAKAEALGSNLRDCFPPLRESKRGAPDSLPDLPPSQYVAAEISREAPIAEPPPEVAAFLASYATPLNAFEVEVLRSPEIVWTSEPPTTLAECPSPMVLRRLVNVLVSQALDETRKGNPVGADRAVEAAWKLNSAYRDSPLVIGQLIATKVDWELLATVRRLALPYEGWRARITSHDYRRSFIASLEGEVLFATAGMLRENAENARGSLWCRLSSAFKAPYERMCIASYSDLMRRATLGLRTWKDPCDFDADSFVRSLHIPRWNVEAGESIPSLVRGYGSSAARVALDQEVTGRILEARSRPEVSWFKEGGVRSAVCESLVWRVEHRPDGTAALSPSKPLPWSISNLTVTPNP